MKEKIERVEENPGGDSESNDELVLEEGGHSTMWNFFEFKPKDDAQGVNNLQVMLWHRHGTARKHYESL